VVAVFSLAFTTSILAIAAFRRADDLGVVRVDLDNGVCVDVIPGPRSTLAGIDGLYWHKGSLIAVQNGIGSPRMVAFRLLRTFSRLCVST